MEMPNVIQTFKFPRQQFKPKVISTREELAKFYNAIDSVKEKALFLLYATSSLRRNEVLSLRFSDIDFNSRIIIPKVHNGETKKSFVSFFNEEAETILKEYLMTHKNHSDKVFPLATDHNRKLWSEAKQKTGLYIIPQRLREFFCMEMANLNVSDRFIGASCGRTPKTVLARNYTDYSPEKLKQIYGKANLKVLA